MNIVVDIARYKKQFPFEVLGQFGVTLDMIIESGITLCVYHFIYAVMTFAPPTVIDVVFMVPSTRDSNFEEVRVDEHCCCRHEAYAGVPRNSYTAEVNKRMPVG